MIRKDMDAVRGLVQDSHLAKENLAVALQLYGEHHPITRLARSLYTQSVQVVMERYRVMAVNTTAYMDAVLA